jgi:hypothetical protein
MPWHRAKARGPAWQVTAEPDAAPLIVFVRRFELVTATACSVLRVFRLAPAKRKWAKIDL